ncbi:MAG: dTMP kinase [Alphaproteobacteria bacterium]|nr:dTMP kinase [Alphaproteobacteria bacterium]
MPSLFIAVEGLDGSGGTTQVRRLAEWFAARGQDVLTTHEPSPGPVGLFIRRALSEPALGIGDPVLPFLFAADRRDHLDRVVIPGLEAGRVVITDRYKHSSLAYQSLTMGLAPVVELNRRFRAPDLTLFLDLDPETCLERVLARGAPRDRFEELDRLREVHEAYQTVLVHCRAQGEHIVRIDASQDIDRVHADCVAQVQALLDGAH